MLKRFLKSDRLWPTGLIIFATAFVAANMAFVTMAFQNKPQLVSENYYQEGYNLRELAERQAAGEATGWNVAVRSLPRELSAQPLVELVVTGRNGAPADSLAGTVQLYRPSNKNLDQPVTSLQYIGGGRYLAVLPQALERGAWQAVVHLARGSAELEQRVPFFVEE